MESTKPWHEDDTFWEAWGPIMFNERRLANTPAEIDGVVSLLGIKPSAHVLDLCCGVGRHSLELARRGFRVTGVDRTEHYLKQASEQAEKEKLNVEFVQEDMRTFSRADTFDAAINMFTSFSYFEDPDEDRQVVLNICRSLKPGGVFILETMGKEVLARIFTENNWYQENGMLILEERRVTRNWGWIENRWIIIKDGKRTEFNVNHRLYAATELIALLTGCSFIQVDTYGGFADSPYDLTARRLVVVGRK